MQKSARDDGDVMSGASELVREGAADVADTNDSDMQLRGRHGVLERETSEEAGKLESIGCCWKGRLSCGDSEKIKTEVMSESQ